ncbi:MAG: winged helix-turn-helix transcriptional regulator [Anaerolineales bacterium]|nr:winged helix-turn-helix transcriptional regulator [Anaerolineales bacterium]
MDVDVSELSPVTFAKAIADETRQRIMRACCCGWVSVGDLAEQIGLKQPTVSHHLAILREAGLVGLRHVGKQTFYTLDQSRVVSCCGQLMLAFAPEQKATAVICDLNP